MLKISSADLINAAPKSLQSVGVRVGTIVLNQGLKVERELGNYQSATIPAYTTTFSISVSAIKIASVQINGEEYELSSPTLSAGQYSFNPITQTLTVYPTSPNYEGLTVIYAAPTSIVKTTRIGADIPALFREWNVNERESIQLNRKFGEHPEGGFTFTLRSENEDEAFNTFVPGAVFTLYGVGYRVISLDYERDLFNYLTHFTVKLQGYWQAWGDRSPLDYPVRTKTLLPDSDGNYRNYYYLSELCQRIGVTLTTPSDLQIYVPKDLNSTVRGTIREILESDRPLTIGCFVYYDNPNAIELRKFGGQRLHPEGIILSESEKNPTLRFNRAGNGATVDGVPLSSEYHNAVLKLERIEWVDDDTVVLNSGDEDPTNPPSTLKGYTRTPFDTDKLISPNQAFDAGGTTKEFKTTWLRGGNTIKEEVRTYGWAYNSLDVNQISATSGGNPPAEIIFQLPISIGDFWQVVRYELKQYIYNAEGYLTGVTTTGWELFRFRQETDQLEAAKLKIRDIEGDFADSDEQAAILAELALYEFNKEPITVSEDYTLDSLAKYYSDLRQQGDEDEDWITPRYVKRKTTLEDSFKRTADPSSTADEPKQEIAAGRIRREEQRTLIMRSLPTELFKEENLSYNAEGQSFRNAATAITFAENTGRPSTQTRLETNRLNAIRPKDHRDEDGTEIKYILNTPTNPRWTFEGENLTFAGGFTFELAIEAALTKVAIANSTNAETITIKTTRDTTIKVGDNYWLNGNIYIVTGIEEAQNIQGIQFLTWGEFSITLGKLITPQLTVIEKRV